jgi:Na+-driven multidrug efflux pump
MSMDGILTAVFKTAFPQVIALGLQRMTLIINVFFISLSGYYGIETNDTVQATIKGIGLGSIIINVFFYGTAQGVNGALETLVSLCYGCSCNEKESELYRIEMRH